MAGDDLVAGDVRRLAFPENRTLRLFKPSGAQSVFEFLDTI
jgi:hypothetical protein